MDDPRLEIKRNAWLATVRPDGRPHLVPIWFVWMEGEFFILTMESSVKARNLRAGSRAVISLEDGSRPLIAECTTRRVEPPYLAGLVEAFRLKYEWNILTDGQYNEMFALQPVKWLAWTP